MGQLSKLSGIADQETMRTLANATILSVANYGSHVFATDKGQCNRIQVKLNSVMRHVNDMIKQLKWMRFADMVDCMKVALLHKILMSSSALHVMMLVNSAVQQTRYSIRDMELKIAWNPKQTRKGLKSFLFTSVKLYNQMKIIGKQMKPAAVSKYIKATLMSWIKK